jgi:hypothetical protein
MRKTVNSSHSLSLLTGAGKVNQQIQQAADGHRDSFTTYTLDLIPVLTPKRTVLMFWATGTVLAKPSSRNTGSTPNSASAPSTLLCYCECYLAVIRCPCQLVDHKRCRLLPSWPHTRPRCCCCWGWGGFQHH